MKKVILYTIIVCILLITVNLWILSKDNPAQILREPTRSASQLLALLGTVLCSLTLIVSTKTPILEKVLGGLDKVFEVHQLMGSIAFVFLINHPLFLAVNSLPNIKAVITYMVPGSDLSYNLGLFALYTMILSFIFLVFIKLPYHIWKISHRLMAVGFLLASLHVALITSDVSSFLPLRLWILGLITAGLLSALYMVVLYKKYGPKHVYQINKIERRTDIVNIYMTPLYKPLRFLPGQFVYISFENKSLGAEMHPFTISSSPNDNFLRISAKIVGDYTLKLPLLLGNEKAFVYGPYGQFKKTSSPVKKTEIWIAGGVGVTPFLSLLRARQNNPENNNVIFFYCYRNEDEGVFMEEINSLAKNDSQITFINWCSRDKKRLTAEQIAAQTNLSLADSILLCGPTVMMENLKSQFKSLGIPEDKIRSENFSFV